MFAAIAGKYDFMNDLLSLGLHRSWRRKAVSLSGVHRGMSVLDCACGTGDLSFAFKEAVGPKGTVVGTDFCEPMIVLAEKKAALHHFDVTFRVEDALNLSSPDESFDVVSVAFGIRNVDDPVACLKELARVVKPGGKVLVLEFGQPMGLFKLLFRVWSFSLMPFLGAVLAKHREAYEYLPRTAAQFPCREKFLALMQASGVFSAFFYRQVTFGVAFIYVGTVK